jgi:hypothetical protein
VQSGQLAGKRLVGVGEERQDSACAGDGLTRVPQGFGTEDIGWLGTHGRRAREGCDVRSDLFDEIFEVREPCLGLPKLPFG